LFGKNRMQSRPAPCLCALTYDDRIMVILASFGADLSFARGQRFAQKIAKIAKWAKPSSKEIATQVRATIRPVTFAVMALSRCRRR
jgi:hypothetical protein